jgi:hypothetical protein
MKRILIIALLMVSAAALVTAQGTDRRAPRSQGGKVMPQVSNEKITVTGNLTIANGMIAIKNDGVAWVIPGLFRYVGFIDGLKDGAQVTIEGTAMSKQADAKTRVLMPLKLKMGNKEYEMGPTIAQKRMPPVGEWPRKAVPDNRGNFRTHGQHYPSPHRQAPKRHHGR